jgi:hypothetical protein
MEGLDPSLSGFVLSALRNQKPTFTNVLQEAELVYSSVTATDRRSEELKAHFGTKGSKALPPFNIVRRLPLYPRSTRLEVAPVLAVEEQEKYERYRSWTAGDDVACLPNYPPDWNQYTEGEDIEQVMLAQVVQPQRTRHCYPCWRPGHFAAECPLIPDEERAGIASRRAAVLKLRPPRFARPSQSYPARSRLAPDKPTELLHENRVVREYTVPEAVTEKDRPVAEVNHPYGNPPSQQ